MFRDDSAGRSTLVPWVLGLAAAGLATGCLIVNEDRLDDAVREAGVDAPPEVMDAGQMEEGIPLVDTCGDAEAFELFDSTSSTMRVDTTGTSNQIVSCGSRGAPGNDGFIAVDVRGGDLWHFHVIPDPTVAGQERDPFLYLLDSTCRNTSCNHFSDACVGPGDEHFAFVAPADGTWYLGIDDRNEGGGVYQLGAYKLNCGDNMAVHGEACDGTANCSRDCREILGVDRPSEQLPNDNEIEANFIELPADRMIEITGSIGGDLCTYPDVYSFENVQEASTLTVEVRKSDGTVCDNPSLTPFDLVLRNPDGDEVAGGQTNASTGCAELVAPDLPAQTFFLYVEHDSPIEDRPVPYRLHLALET
ncbi:MAG TPA: hypothetical protein RMH99_07660 [Sandaracinaceae bacterium LLY-WYZ-13_1]|nr:hypothetical protein [Sandaracinaceae bacterium LLY-WYZ-13_1]